MMKRKFHNKVKVVLKNPIKFNSLQKKHLKILLKNQIKYLLLLQVNILAKIKVVINQIKIKAVKNQIIE